MKELGIWILVSLVLGFLTGAVSSSENLDALPIAVLFFLIDLAFIVAAICRIGWLLIGAWL